MDSRKKVGVEDFIMLQNVNEESVLKNLQERHAQDEIYTYIGDVIVSVNPFKDVPIYTESHIQLYRGKQSFELPPHVFSIADNAYNALAHGKRNQCIIISGESGAGKTEAAKRILQYIAAVSGKTEDVDRVKQQLIGTNPVLEAFGNAKTLRNDNSSRFGKYMQIEFDFKGDPVGGKITNYLLEKSRVVRPLEGERNFHIFYLLLTGASSDELNNYKLTSKPEDFRILKESGCTTVKSINDAAWYKEVKHGMKMIGFSSEDEKSIFKVVAAVLHLGNIKFKGKGDGCEVSTPEDLKKAAALLEVDPATLSKSLTFRSITAGGGKAIEKALSEKEASDGVDGLIKALYERLFKWIVNRINENIQYQSDEVSEDQLSSIGVLDIYGFEILQFNSFEQFCINFCNEKLQQLFIELTLKKEQEEYVSEGIVWTPVSYFNNKNICDLIENKPNGIIAFMDEEISLATGTELGFLEKITKIFDGHPHFQSSISAKKGSTKIQNGAFLLKHYAGEVLYSTENILDKNRDQLFKLHQEMMSSSKSRAVRIMFPPIDSKSTKRPPSAGTQFKVQVNELMKTLMGCEPHYIRTIKSNDKKMGGVFQEELVRHQVRYLGLLENIQVRRAGFCYRKDYDSFLKRYKILSKETWPNFRGSSKDGAIKLMQSLGFKSDEFQAGKTKIFIKNPQTIFTLEEKRDEKIPVVVTKIQARYRGYNVRVNYEKFRAALAIQKAARKFLRVIKLKRMTPEQKTNFINQQLTARLLENRKQGWRDDRTWKGNYMPQVPQEALQKVFAKFNDAKVVFAAAMNRINSKNQVAERGLILTEKSLYYIDPGNYAMKHRIDLRTLEAIVLSSKPDHYFILKDSDPKNYDWILESKYRTEFLVTLYRVYRGVNGKPLPIEITNKTTMRVKPKKTRTVTWETGSGPMTPLNKTSIVIYAPKSDELINQQTVYLGPKVTLETHVIKKKEKSYKAIFDYEPMEQDELELKTNDVVVVKSSDRSDGGWSTGTNTRTNKFGVFPLNYCELVN